METRAKQASEKQEFFLSRYPNNDRAAPILTPRKDILWEARAVFNSGVVRDDNVFKMVYRTFPSNLEETAPKINQPGFYFGNKISYIGYAESQDGINFQSRNEPLISPDTDYDRYGCEDPRVTKFGDTFYITYTAIDAPLDDEINQPNIRIALATTKDFITIKKHGIIGPPTSSKASALFPELINGGKIGLVLTIEADSSNSHIAIRYYDSIEKMLQYSEKEWNDFLANSKETAMLGTHPWLHRGPELGAPPIKTDRGWLFIYSAESMSDSWTISAALTDLNEPHKLISKTPGYILQPTTTYEREGLVPNVTFPSGIVIVGDDLYVYYGCADTVIGLATCNLKNLLDHIDKFKDCA
jgi:predicted GH43/DUF377 family glycosyl hydrolase